MKRLILFLFLGFLVFWWAARHVDRAHHRDRALHQARHAMARAGHEARQALREAGDDVRDAFREASDEIHEAMNDPDDSPASEREEADDLPVPIVRGSRVVDAQLKPPVSAPDHAPIHVQTVSGLLSATEERARSEAAAALDRVLAEWLKPDVKNPWTPPANLVQSVVLATVTTPVHKEYGDVYLTEIKVNLSPESRRAFLNVYTREVVRGRMIALGGGLVFVLVCLAVVSSYIRADEATRGYYTQRLRLLAAASVGAAGVLIYQLAV